MTAATRPAYRQDASAPAPSRRTSDQFDRFESGLRQIARRLRVSVPDLSDRDREWLYDLAREEARYPMPTVRKLCAISRRSRRPEDREAFALLIREESSAGPLNVEEAFNLECPATGLADPLQREFEKHQTPIIAAKVRIALERQLAVTQLALEAVVTWEREYESGVSGAARAKG